MQSVTKILLTLPLYLLRLLTVPCQLPALKVYKSFVPYKQQRRSFAQLDLLSKSQWN